MFAKADINEVNSSSDRTMTTVKTTNLHEQETVRGKKPVTDPNEQRVELQDGDDGVQMPKVKGEVSVLDFTDRPICRWLDLSSSDRNCFSTHAHSLNGPMKWKMFLDPNQQRKQNLSPLRLLA